MCINGIYGKEMVELDLGLSSYLPLMLLCFVFLAVAKKKYTGQLFE